MYTETECELMDVWQKLLPDVTIDLDTDFFTLGTDSLAAFELAQALADLMAQRGLALRDPLVEIFSSPTIRELARVIDQAAAP